MTLNLRVAVCYREGVQRRSPRCHVHHPVRHVRRQCEYPLRVIQSSAIKGGLRGSQPIATVLQACNKQARTRQTWPELQALVLLQQHLSVRRILLAKPISNIAFVCIQRQRCKLICRKHRTRSKEARKKILLALKVFNSFPTLKIRFRCSAGLHDNSGGELLQEPLQGG